MAKINLLDKLPVTLRDVKKRVHEKRLLDPIVAKEFGQKYFDGERRFGYGGYYYDGRWNAVAKKLIKHYSLSQESRILEIGCAKGFLLHDLKKVQPKCSVRGLDISSYARDNAHEKVKEFIDLGSAHQLPYADNEFDLVIALNTIHNLPLKHCKEALCEIERVTKDSGAKYISVDAWNNNEEKQRVLDWSLTARTLMHAEEWKKVFEEVGYEGDYWFTVP